MVMDKEPKSNTQDEGKQNNIDVPQTISSTFEKFSKPQKIGEVEQKNFTDGENNPLIGRPRYPKLDHLYDDGEDQAGTMVEMKHNLYMAAMALSKKDKNESKKDEILRDLKYEKVIKKEKELDLLETAQILLSKNNSFAMREKFMALNIDLYGEYRKDLFESAVRKTTKQIVDFEPKDARGELYKTQLLSLGLFNKRGQESGGGDLFDDKPFIDRTVKALEKQHEGLLATIPEDFIGELSSAQAKEMFNEILEKNDYDGWGAEVDDDASSVRVNHVKKILYVPGGKSYDEMRMKKLTVHEIGTHIARRVNAEKNGVPGEMVKGTSDFGDAEEGLAVLSEFIMVAGDEGGVEARIAKSRDGYVRFGIALGADGVERDAKDTFAILYRLEALKLAKDNYITDTVLEKAKGSAYLQLKRIYRGTNWAMKGVVHLKDHQYYASVVSNLEYLKKNEGNLEEAIRVAYMAKYNHTDKNERDKILTLLDREDLIDRIK